MKPTRPGSCSLLPVDDPSEAPVVPATPPTRYASTPAAATTRSPYRSLRPIPLAATMHSRHTAPAAVSNLETRPECMLHTLALYLVPTAPSTSHRSRYGASPATEHALQIPNGRGGHAEGSHATDRTLAVLSCSITLLTRRGLQVALPDPDEKTLRPISPAVAFQVSLGIPSADSHADPPQLRLPTPEHRRATHHADALSTECCRLHSDLQDDSETTAATDRTTEESLPDAASHADAPARAALLPIALPDHLLSVLRRDCESTAQHPALRARGSPAA